MIDNFWSDDETEPVKFTVDKSVLFNTSAELEDISNAFRFSVNYHFPASKFRNPIMDSGVQYGQAWSFDALYRKLCKEFNDGQLFIDEYFDNIFPYSLKDEMEFFFDDIKTDIINQYDEMIENIKLTKKGEFDKRYTTVLRPLLDFTKYARSFVKEQGLYWAERIKDDIILQMESGVLPTYFAKADISEKTKEKRFLAGLNVDTVFMASGQLIHSIIIDVRVGKKKWKKGHFITV